jgi:hypothetical protein
MSDVFISYAREDQALARLLRDNLAERGYRVWWDVELLATDDFNDKIRNVLSDAKAVIVIWTTTSVNSKFVRDEARFAMHQEKLISTKTADVKMRQLPFGFQGQHTEDLLSIDRIERAVHKLCDSDAVFESAQPIRQDDTPYITNIVVEPAQPVRQDDTPYITNITVVLCLQTLGFIIFVLIGDIISNALQLSSTTGSLLSGVLSFVLCVIGWYFYGMYWEKRNSISSFLFVSSNTFQLFFSMTRLSIGFDATPSLGIFMTVALPLGVFIWSMSRLE